MLRLLNKAGVLSEHWPDPILARARENCVGLTAGVGNRSDFQVKSLSTLHKYRKGDLEHLVCSTSRGSPELVFGLFGFGLYSF